jgi:hypothetical protein
MQGELVKAGNLKEPIDLAKMTAPDILAEAAKRVASKNHIFTDAMMPAEKYLPA